MSKPFDATLKHLLELSPLSWADLAGFPAASVEVIDADVSTVTGASDKTLRARSDIEWLLDINFQRGPDASVPRRTHLYSTLLEYRHQLPVRSVVVLLTPKAQLSVISGTHQRGFPGEEPYDTFRYWVLKVWELPPERLLSGGLGTLPLAPIGAVTEEQLPSIIQQMKARLASSGTSEAKDLWAATYVLLGLRYEREFVDRLLQGVVEMEESTTYQGIIEKGIAQGIEKGIQKGIEKGIAQGKEEGKREEARRMVLLLGEEHLGPASSEVTATIQGINDLERLHQLALRVGQVGSWEELLRSPSP